MKYEILEHPAELRIRVYGKTLEELFSNAAFAMGEILNSDPNVRIYPNDPNIKQEIIKIESTDINSLLVDFLSEILAKSQINKCVYEIIKIKVERHPERIRQLAEESRDLSKDGDGVLRSPRSTAGFPQNDKRGSFLKAEFIGYSVSHFDEDIKAITYEDLDIKKVDGIWQTMIVFDI